jgi:hypothetical protein
MKDRLYKYLDDSVTFALKASKKAEKSKDEYEWGYWEGQRYALTILDAYLKIDLEVNSIDIFREYLQTNIDENASLGKYEKNVLMQIKNKFNLIFGEEK